MARLTRNYVRFCICTVKSIGKQMRSDAGNMIPVMTGGGTVYFGDTALSIGQVVAMTLAALERLIKCKCLTICSTVPNRPIGGVRGRGITCLLYTSPSPRDGLLSRMPSSA